MYYTIVWSYSSWGGGPQGVMSGKFRTLHGPKSECELVFNLLVKDENPNLEYVEVRDTEGGLYISWVKK
jgi:hypothetical protein